MKSNHKVMHPNSYFKIERRFSFCYQGIRYYLFKRISDEKYDFIRCFKTYDDALARMATLIKKGNPVEQFFFDKHGEELHEQPKIQFYDSK